MALSKNFGNEQKPNKKSYTRRSGKVGNRPKEIKVNAQFHLSKIVPPADLAQWENYYSISAMQNIWIFMKRPRLPLARTSRPDSNRQNE